MNDTEYQRWAGFDGWGWDNEPNDPRRCPRHPNVVISSPDGAYDAPCGRCEAEMENSYHDHADDEARAAHGE